MNRIPKDYVERVYAGWLGKVIGVRHGANIEGWEYETIKKVYGEIEGYIYDFKNFAADDDTNGPYFFIRALEDETHTRELTPQQIGRAWLNYAAYEQGFYWWGGYGISSEHTAYLNLRAGIEAPKSGSIEHNGERVARQIGGQIFIDSWGLVVPCDYQLAAEYAEKAASVSHDSDGVYGGMFIAACISAAFCNTKIEDVLECGFEVIPQNCEYATMGRDVWRFYRDNKEDWRACFAFIKEKYGYQHYSGACHIIPNAAVMFLSMLYGQGDYSKTINICNMCGWDTDCNVGNVATVLGVMVGLDGIDDSWKKPINDLLICSSVIGSLNILDVSGGAYYLAGLGYKIANEEAPAEYRDSLIRGERSYDFELAGATHSFRIETNTQHGCSDLVLSNSDEEAYSGKRSLKATAEMYQGGDEIDVYLQTYYYPMDFDDSRYDPSFSPLVYPGQTLNCAVKIDEMTECDILICLYVWDSNKNKLIKSENQPTKPGEWNELTWQIPTASDACLYKAGIKLICYNGDRNIGRKHIVFYIDDFSITGEANYELDFANSSLDVWSPIRQEINQFTKLKGNWELAANAIYGSSLDYGECYTGLPTWKDYSITTKMAPITGTAHRLLFRVQGGIRSYAVGLEKDGKVVLFKNNNGYTALAEAICDWQCGETYVIHVALKDNAMTVSVDGGEKIKYVDREDAYLKGQVGFGVYDGSRCRFENLKVEPSK